MTKDINEEGIITSWDKTNHTPNKKTKSSCHRGAPLTVQYFHARQAMCVSVPGFDWPTISSILSVYCNIILLLINSYLFIS